MERDDHVFAGRVIGTADGNLSREAVLDDDTTSALFTDVRVVRSGEPQLVRRVAPESTDGLASGALRVHGPLTLVVAGRACVRAECVGGATSRGRGDDAVDLDAGNVPVGRLLETSPALSPKPINRNSAPSRREDVT